MNPPSVSPRLAAATFLPQFWAERAIARFAEIRSYRSGHPPAGALAAIAVAQEFAVQHQDLDRDFIEQRQGPHGPSFAPQFSF
jgi:hypothetical protein